MNKLWGLAFLWMIMAMLGGICEMAQFSTGAGATSTNTTGHIQTLLTGINWSEATNPAGFITVGFGYLRNWIATLGDLLFFNYSYFQGEWGIIRWVLFIPLGIGVIWMLANWARGTS